MPRELTYCCLSHLCSFCIWNIKLRFVYCKSTQYTIIYQLMINWLTIIRPWINELWIIQLVWPFSKDLEDLEDTNMHTHHKPYFLVAHVPIWPFSIWHHLPHEDPKAPDITSRTELTMLESLRSCPPYRYFTTLRKRK